VFGKEEDILPVLEIETQIVQPIANHCCLNCTGSPDV
jgi:hypothetical protein